MLDKGPPKETVEKLKKIALGHDQVEEVHIIRLRLSLGAYTGDFHILVNPELSIIEAHEIPDKIKLIDNNKFALIAQSGNKPDKQIDILDIKNHINTYCFFIDALGIYSII